MSLLGAYRVGSLFQNSAVLRRQLCGFVTVKARLYVRAAAVTVSAYTGFDAYVETISSG